MVFRAQIADADVKYVEKIEFHLHRYGPHDTLRAVSSSIYLTD